MVWPEFATTLCVVAGNVIASEMVALLIAFLVADPIVSCFPVMSEPPSVMLVTVSRSLSWTSPVAVIDCAWAPGCNTTAPPLQTEPVTVTPESICTLFWATRKAPLVSVEGTDSWVTTAEELKASVVLSVAESLFGEQWLESTARSSHVVASNARLRLPRAARGFVAEIEQSREVSIMGILWQEGSRQQGRWPRGRTVQEWQCLYRLFTDRARPWADACLLKREGLRASAPCRRSRTLQRIGMRPLWYFPPVPTKCSALK
jgi:hypothetical protein